MATIRKEFDVAVPFQFAWDAIRDVGNVHTRLAAGFVVGTMLEGAVRTLTFANAVVAQERIVAVDDGLHRLAYAVIGGKPSHHNASIQVFPATGSVSRILWITDFLPDDMMPSMAQMVEAGSAAIKSTLESTFAQAMANGEAPPPSARSLRGLA